MARLVENGQICDERPSGVLGRFGAQAGLEDSKMRVSSPLRVGLYTICFYFEAVVHESTILSLPPPAHLHCPSWYNTIARLLGRIRLPHRPPVCMLYTIQYW